MGAENYSKKPEETTILLVDDNAENIYLLKIILGDKGYRLVTAENGQEALDCFDTSEGAAIDLVITDIMMPEIDGLELTRRIRNNPKTHPIPVMLLTANKVDHGDIAKGLELGADDFLAKPVNPVEIIARVRSLLRVKHLHDKLTDVNDHLTQLVEERTMELFSARDTALFGFAKLAEYRDPETGEHLERIRSYTRTLAEQLAKTGVYNDVITEDFIQQVVFSSPLHDIGKVGIRDSILLKPGKLTKEEFEIMKTHSTIGGDTLAAAERHSAGADGFLSMAKNIAYYHHERWDGKGYPSGLAGENIPLVARIMAVADVYDALVSKRVYKEAYPHEKAHDIIVEEWGKHFDPAVAEAFLATEEKFIAINKLHENA